MIDGQRSAHRHGRRIPVALSGLSVVLAAACGVEANAPAASSAAGSRAPERLQAQVVRELPVPAPGFVQGLELADGHLYEGTGGYGESQLRLWSWPAWEPVAAVPLAAAEFGEGITVTPDSIWQLTWRDGVAYRYDRNNLDSVRRYHLDGEGWGICALGETLVVSDGTARLAFYSAVDFSPRGEVTVTSEGTAVTNINELDCSAARPAATPSAGTAFSAADGATAIGSGIVWANLWQTEEIIGIDLATGTVSQTVNARSVVELIPPAVRADPDAVLNGIARIPGSENYLLTGKNWPTAFEVNFA